MDIVWNILLVLLAALGLTEVIRILVLKVTTTGRSSRMVVIIPVSGHHDDIEYVSVSYTHLKQYRFQAHGGD